MSFSFVQAASGSSSSASPATTGSITTTRRNLVVAFIGANVTGTFTMSDNFGNTWKQIGTTVTVAGIFGVLYYSVLDSGGAGHTFTGASNGSFPNLSIIVQEFNGIFRNPFDVSASGTGTGGTVTSANSVVTNYPSELVVGVCCAGSNTPVAGAGFSNLTTKADGGATNVAGMESKIVTSTGAQAATFTGPAANWIVITATFNEKANAITSTLRPHPFSPGLAR